ncbi:MAG: hypothetical protein JWQ93_2214 [Marmoricola sp.]|nr:hypothetical protein [Marmoricola sp.]
MPRLRAALALLSAAGLLAGCGGGQGSTGEPSKQPPTKSSTRGSAAGVIEVPADAETRPSQHSGDSVDDPAIWVDAGNPAESLVIGNDKRGALETYNLDGTLEQRIESSTTFWGNVDIRQDVPLASGPTDVVAVANGGVRLYSMDGATRRLSPITADGAPLDTGGGEGVCLHASPTDGLSVFMVFISGGVRQFALEDDGSGNLSLQLVRSFKVGSEAEGCVVDDVTDTLYVSEENVGVWKYDADPEAGPTRTMVDEIKPQGHQIADIEGVTLVDDGNGEGLVITSSQGQTGEKSYFSTFDRDTGAYRSSFRIVAGDQADGCSHTDGITATSQPLGPDFPHGAFICQDDSNTTPGEAGNQDFKLTRLEKVRP